MDNPPVNKDNNNKNNGHVIMTRKDFLKSLKPLQKAVIALIAIVLIGVSVIALIIVFLRQPYLLFQL